MRDQQDDGERDTAKAVSAAIRMYIAASMPRRNTPTPNITACGLRKNRIVENRSQFWAPKMEGRVLAWTAVRSFPDCQESV